ncbi:MAG: hypothetical protein AAF916_06520 [Planctomycetota bacterium]
MSAARPLILICHPPEKGPEIPFLRRLGERLTADGVDLAVLHTDGADVTPLAGGAMQVKLTDWRRAGDAAALPRGGSGGAAVIEAAGRWATRHPESRLGPEQAATAAAWVDAIAASALATYRPDLLVVWNGEHDVQVALRQKAELCGVPIVRMERAPLPGFGYVSTDGLMGDAAFAKRPIAWPDDVVREQAHACWSAVKADLATGGATWYDQPTAGDRLRGRLKVAGDVRLLLFAGQVDADTQNHFFSPYASNLEAFQAVVDGARATERCFVIGKHHPMSDTPAADYRQAVEGVGVWLEDGSLPQLLGEVDAVAAVNSSVLFESAARGLPTMALGRTLIDAHGGFAPWYPDDAVGSIAALLDRKTRDADAERFDDVMAWLLFADLFAFADDAEPGLRGIDAVARTLRSALPETPPAFAPVLADAGRVFELLREGAWAVGKVRRMQDHPLFGRASQLRKRLRETVRRARAAL